MCIRLEYLQFTVAILKVTVKIMHISTVGISKMVTDMANIRPTIDMKYEVVHRLFIAIFKLCFGSF